jgi:hypothetical protein
VCEFRRGGEPIGDLLDVSCRDAGVLRIGGSESNRLELRTDFLGRKFLLRQSRGRARRRRANRRDAQSGFLKPMLIQVNIDPPENT